MRVCHLSSMALDPLWWQREDIQAFLESLSWGCLTYKEAINVQGFT